MVKKIIWVIIGLWLLGCNPIVKDPTAELKQDSINQSVNFSLQILQQQIDSLKQEKVVLAKSVLYLDSCQQLKATKAERAERRGKFLGGLLKGLLPL